MSSTRKIVISREMKCIKFRDEIPGETSIQVSILDTRNAQEGSILEMVQIVIRVKS